MCRWCVSPRPVHVDGIDGITPGHYLSNVTIDDGVCPTCEPKWLAQLEKQGGASHPDTPGLSSGEGTK